MGSENVCNLTIGKYPYSRCFHNIQLCCSTNCAQLARAAVRLQPHSVTNASLPSENFDTQCAGCSKEFSPHQKRKICTQCKVARYCGKACQVSHWKIHKSVCKVMKQADTGAICKLIVRPTLVEPLTQAAGSGVRYSDDTLSGLMCYEEDCTLDMMKWIITKFESEQARQFFVEKAARPLPRRFWMYWLNSQQGQALCKQLKLMWVTDDVDPANNATYVAAARTQDTGQSVGAGANRTGRQMLRKISKRTRQAMEHPSPLLLAILSNHNLAIAKAKAVCESLGQVGPGPLGPWAHLGPGPLGPWAHLGPGPTWAPGPFDSQLALAIFVMLKFLAALVCESSGNHRITK